MFNIISNYNKPIIHTYIILYSLFRQVLCIVAIAVVAVSAEYGHSSQHIHRHDGHHQVVEFKDKHGHHHVDYYVSNTNEFFMVQLIVAV